MIRIFLPGRLDNFFKSTPKGLSGMRLLVPIVEAFLRHQAELEAPKAPSVT
jgi:hypothetical protein